MNDRIDLHVHSNCSDGTYTPEELVSYALQKNLRAFALTDHDTVAGVLRAQQAASGTSLSVIPGVELSTNYHGRDIHILGLDVHIKDSGFRNYLEQFRQARDIRNRKMLGRLQEHGVAVTEEQMHMEFPGCVWTRAHFARYLKDHGYVKDMKEAFARYVGDGAPCFVPKEQISPFEAVSLLLDNGAHPVLAHPLLYHLSSSELETLVTELCRHGLQGLEAIYSTNRFSDESSMKQLARRHNLCITGGSDFHGSNKPDIDLGTGRGNLEISYRLWENLRGCR